MGGEGNGRIVIAKEDLILLSQYLFRISCYWEKQNSGAMKVQGKNRKEGPRITVPKSLRWAICGAISVGSTSALLVRLFSPECEPQNIAAYDKIKQ
ncbi:hypothetical protein GH714_026520 [Hevea brasiliensis]|uniref:DUF7875 domain-containing protein n=1 Tax=Hevea brasiliensis TaxID=3981 RepID=A0A6A6M3F9_HEVBR|nr:hypothetical protein GH714_026520 [Hevea brasiliensis]